VNLVDLVLSAAAAPARRRPDSAATAGSHCGLELRMGQRDKRHEHNLGLGL
jgi:hypothetical protein